MQKIVSQPMFSPSFFWGPIGPHRKDTESSCCRPHRSSVGIFLGSSAWILPAIIFQTCIYSWYMRLFLASQTVIDSSLYKQMIFIFLKDCKFYLFLVWTEYFWKSPFCEGGLWINVGTIVFLQEGNVLTRDLFRRVNHKGTIHVSPEEIQD